MAWTFYCLRAHCETYLQITATNDSSLTPGVTAFHINKLRPCTTSSNCLLVPVTTPKDDVSNISDVCIQLLTGRRGKYLLFMPHFNDDDIPHVWHLLNEVHRTKALHKFMETPQWHAFTQTQEYIDFMRAHPARSLESQRLPQ
jgi:hypothetical protein